MNAPFLHVRMGSAGIGGQERELELADRWGRSGEGS